MIHSLLPIIILLLPTVWNISCPKNFKKIRENCFAVSDTKFKNFNDALVYCSDM